MVQTIRQNPAYRLVALNKTAPCKASQGAVYPSHQLTNQAKMSKLRPCLAGLLFFAACTSHTAGPETAPSPSQPVSVEPAIHTSLPTTSWEFNPSEQTSTYRSTSYTVVHEISNTRSRADTLRVDTRFTMSLNQLQTPTTISGYIESAAITRGNQPSLQLNSSPSRMEFTGDFAGGELTLKSSPAQTECTSPTISILGEIRPAITSHPKILSPSSTWADSTLATTCSGYGVPTELKTIRSYRVLGETVYSRTQALVIERAETTRFNGSGSQDQHQVQIDGTGTGTSKIYLDTKNGATIAVETSQRIETVIKASGRLQRYIQDITQKIELVP